MCCLSKAVNIQVVEDHSAPLMADGLTRMSCEVGLPARMLIGQDSAFMKILRGGEITIVDLETQMRTRATMDFQLCPVAGHNGHGFVESKIRVIQDAMKKLEVGTQHLHATGLQTWLKMAESDLNACPFGITIGRSELITPILNMISPDQLRLGRISTCVPNGPYRLPNSPRDLFARVNYLYRQWHTLFNDTMLPALLSSYQPKWFNQDSDLACGDVVFFRKH